MDPRKKGNFKFAAMVVDKLSTRPAWEDSNNYTDAAMREKVIQETLACSRESGYNDSHCELTESVITAWFKLLYRLYIVPYNVVLNGETGRYEIQQGSLFRKILRGTVAACLILDLIVQSVEAVLMVEANSLASIFIKVRKIMYIGYALSVDYAIACKGSETCEILTSLRSIATKFTPGHSTQRARKLQVIACGLTVAALLKALHYTFFVNWSERYTILDGIPTFLTGIAHERLTRLSVLVSGNKSTNKELELAIADIPPTNAGRIILGVCLLFTKMELALFWVMACVMMILWAFVFCLMFKSAVGSTKTSFNELNSSEIRTYNVLSSVLDRVNRTYGWVTFFCIFCGAMHFAVDITLEDNMMGMRNQLIHAKVGNWTMLVLFAAHLVISSHVHHTARRIVDRIKAGSGSIQASRKGEHAEDDEDMTRGISLIFHEIETNRIGIEGSVFFTVTYSFIGTVISLICTYAVLVMQGSTRRP